MPGFALRPYQAEFLESIRGVIRKQFRGPQDWRSAANRALVTPAAPDSPPPEP